MVKPLLSGDTARSAHCHRSRRVIGLRAERPATPSSSPPLYLDRLSNAERESAWGNAVRLAQNIEVVILDHHLMRSEEGAVWLDELSATVGKKVYCAADFMGRTRWLLEAGRVRLYEEMPVPDEWHDNYVKGQVDPDGHF